MYVTVKQNLNGGGGEVGERNSSVISQLRLNC